VASDKVGGHLQGKWRVEMQLTVGRASGNWQSKWQVARDKSSASGKAGGKHQGKW